MTPEDESETHDLLQETHDKVSEMYNLFMVPPPRDPDAGPFALQLSAMLRSWLHVVWTAKLVMRTAGALVALGAAVAVIVRWLPW